MTWFSKPSAARSTILARTTSRYGNVYRRARASRTRRSVADNVMTYGLFLGMIGPLVNHQDTDRGLRTLAVIRNCIYGHLY